MKLSIYKKMMSGFIAVIVIMVLATTYVLIELHDVTGAAKMTMSANVKSVDHAKQLKTLVFDEEGYAQCPHYRAQYHECSQRTFRRVQIGIVEY